MKRSKMFDPPEYLEWEAAPEVMAEFAGALSTDSRKTALLEEVDAEVAVALYRGLLRFRLHDIALKRWVRQGVITKAWLGTGEEAVSVGCVHGLAPDDVVGPMIRNAGACHEKGMSLASMFRAYLGTSDQITKGRDLHTGAPELGVIPPTSFVGALVPVFAGHSLAFKIRGEDRVALTWVGDGSVHTGEFHEGLSLAAARDLPLILVIQDNQIALGTLKRAHHKGDFTKLHLAYGVESISCHGNNVLDVYASTRIAREICRQGKGPVLILAETFRMGGHATHDEAEGRRLIEDSVYEYWGKRDPVGMFETWLIESGPALNGDSKDGNAEYLADIETEIRAEVEREAEAALASRDSARPGAQKNSEGVYADEAS